MEIKKEEIENYIENSLYFLCNQDEIKGNIELKKILN